MPHDNIDLGQRVNIGSGDGLLTDGTKPLPEPMMTYHSAMRFCGTHLTNFTGNFQGTHSLMRFKNSLVKLLPHPSGVNELTFHNTAWDTVQVINKLMMSKKDSNPPALDN